MSNNVHDFDCPCPACYLNRCYLTAHWPEEEREKAQRAQLAVWAMTARPGERAPWPVRLIAEKFGLET